MDSNWAYTAYGRLRKTDFWDWFGPIAQADSNAFVTSLYNSARFEIGVTNQNSDLLDRGVNIVGFDGKQWLAGRIASPASVLDPVRFPGDKYGCDEHGRSVSFLHGYVSDHGDLPTHLPLVDANHFRQQHETRIIPLWERSNKGEGKDKVGLGAERKVTSFEPLQDGVPLEQHLPAEAIESLRLAHGKGRPIAIHYDPGTQQWAELRSFRSDLIRTRERVANRSAQDHAPRPPIQTAPKTVSPGLPGDRSVPEKAGENAKSWVASLWEHPGGKFAIVGGTVALGALMTYWVYKAMSAKDKRSNQQSTIG